MTAKKDIKVGVRTGRPPTESQSHSRIAGDISRKSHCINKLDFNPKNTNSNQPLVIPLREYEDYNRIIRRLCDAGAAEGAFIVLDI